MFYGRQYYSAVVCAQAVIVLSMLQVLALCALPMVKSVSDSRFARRHHQELNHVTIGNSIGGSASSTGFFRALVHHIGDETANGEPIIDDDRELHWSLAEPSLHSQFFLEPPALADRGSSQLTRDLVVAFQRIVI